MDGTRAPIKTPRVGTVDSPSVESASVRLSVHHGVVSDVVRQGAGQDLVPVDLMHTYSVVYTRLSVEHSVFDLHDETRNQESDRSCCLRS